MTTCIFLAGAPDSDSLTWDERHLLNQFEPPIQRFLGREASLSSTADGDASTLAIPKWRSIPFNLNNSTALHTNRDRGESQQGTQFLSFLHDASTNYDASHEQDHLAFLEQSLARLDELESSQITPMLEDETTTTFNSNLDDSLTGEEGTPDLSNSQGAQERLATVARPQHPQTQQHQPFHIIGPISDLRSIPSATHIDSIFPGTMTLNLLCAVISVSPLRTVQLRRRQRAGITGNPQHPNSDSADAAHAEERELLEILLGDETRAGFSATFWFLPESDAARILISHTTERRGGAGGGGRPNVWDANEDSKTRRQNLLSLRAGDVVLIRNLALSVFKGGVYGQSLRETRGKTGLGRGNFTDVRVLEEENGEGFLSSLPPSMRGQVRGKMRRVREWRDGFVGPGVRAQDGRAGGVDVGGGWREREWLPADTQSPVK
ncbi:hypothetical protein KC343_g4697 [Hortaea werneckii]|uniref:Uncharacterized protein n=1 Tax=Hortaea werneckii TaxID=91943 RepID=A0A3M7F0G9_HORWE|nr:hypothetical protein KC323_g701 [Hortaea werneckii]KAI7257432.1 hypothetical protein KC352_g10934 [Hortaea werneckii]KAI7567246.1 hypothetical protein KC317_g5117 [Hortaea werneckii]KAI7619311.1 hypothetical protein KC346_g4636 [Hortaea werneckii]KAI7630318.1 hypothetical protein KC343_g4697 [Hortaea werneckii]